VLYVLAESTADTQPQLPTGFAEIAGDYFPILYAQKEQCSVWILPRLVAPETHEHKGDFKEW
jgi:hypothetical protein